MDDLDKLNVEVDTDDLDTEHEKAEAPLSADVELEQPDDAAPMTDDGPDYEAIISNDISELSSEFPELRNLKDITELHNPLRYAALRDLGLTAREAYLATAKRNTQDTRAHLSCAHGRSAAASVGMMTQQELSAARELFPGLNDSQLQKLYKKVTK